MKNVTFRQRLFLSLAAVAMIALLPAALMGIVSAQTSVVWHTTVQLETVADLKAAEVQQWLEQGKQAAQLSAGLHEMQEHLPLLLNPSDETTRVQSDLFAELKTIAGAHDYLRSISLLHPAGGQVLLSTALAQEGRQWQDAETFRQGQRALYASPITFTGEGEPPVLFVSAPVRDEAGALLAVVVVEMNVAGLQTLFENRAGLGQTGRAYLADNSGRYVTLPPGVAGTSLGTAAESEGVRRVVTGENGSATYPDPQGTAVLGVYRWLPEANLALLVEVDRAELTGQIRYIWMLIALGNLLALAIGAIVARALANRLVAPLEQIADTARTLRTGDLSSRTPLGSTGDELGQLAVAFNEMAESLQQSQEDLAQLVAERTAALEQTEARLKGIVESAPDAIISVDAEQHVIMFNKAAEAMFGWASSEAMGQHISTFIPERSRRAHEGYVRTFAQSPEKSRAPVVNRAMFARRRNGAEFPVEAAISKVDIGGQLILTVIIRDITARVQAEAALQESEERYRLLVNLSPEAIAVHRAGRFVYINVAGVNLLGASGVEDLTGKPIMDIVHPDFREIVQKRVRGVLEEGKPASVLEEKLLRLDGQVFDAEVTGAPITYGGQPAVQVIFRDVTERKKMEEALLLRTEELQTVFDITPVPLFVVDSGQHVWQMNKAAQAFSHVPEGETLGKRIGWVLDCLHYLDVPEGCGFGPNCKRCVLRKSILQAFRTRQPIFGREGEVFLKVNEGFLCRDVHVSTAYFEGDAGPRVVVAVEDITDWKQAEAALQERNRELKDSQEYSRNVIDSSLDMIITVDLDRRIVAFNQAAQAIFGYGPEEVVGQPVDVIYADPREGHAVHDTTVEIGSCRQEVLNKRKDGQTFPAFISASLLRDAEGALVGVMGVSRDITEQKRADRQIREALAEKEMLLREVNHRVGNNLTAIAGMLALARQEIHKTDPASHQDTIRNLEQRVTSLSTVHSMLSASEWSPLRLNELAGKIINESLRIVPPQKQVSVTVTPAGVRVAPDLAHNLALVINELATNTVKYALQERTAVHIVVSIMQDGDDITVTFRDDGPGYPEDVLRRGRHGVGLDFIETVIHRSLRGEVEIRNDDGAVTVMRFKQEA